MLIKQKNFEGPFDLLLDLIEKSEINIEDIKISEITEQFIRAMNEISIDADRLSDFITVATQLLILKTRSLIQVEDEEEFSKEDLIKRLIEYKKYKEVSESLKEYEERGKNYLNKFQEDLSDYSQEEEDIEIIGDKNLLAKIYTIIIERYIEFEDRVFDVNDVLNREEYSVEEYITKIEEKISVNETRSFKSLLENVTNKQEIIVVFLGILEMSKSKEIRIFQDEDDIYLSRVDVDERV